LWYSNKFCGTFSLSTSSGLSHGFFISNLYDLNNKMANRTNSDFAIGSSFCCEEQ
ncbi:22708_t:CDS:1, partial [Gigaspora rosea]